MTWLLEQAVQQYEARCSQVKAAVLRIFLDTSTVPSTTRLVWPTTHPWAQ